MLIEVLEGVGVLLYFSSLLAVGACVAIAVAWRWVRSAPSEEIEAKLQRLRGESLVSRTLRVAGVLMLSAGILLVIGKWVQAGGSHAELGWFVREEKNTLFGLIAACVILAVAKIRISQIAEERDELEKAGNPHPPPPAAE